MCELNNIFSCKHPNSKLEPNQNLIPYPYPYPNPNLNADPNPNLKLNKF